MKEKKRIFILMMKQGKHKIFDKSVNYLEEISFKMFKRYVVWLRKIMYELHVRAHDVHEE